MARCLCWSLFLQGIKALTQLQAVAARVGKPIDMVDSQPIDPAFFNQP